jgi:hypothetical protein
MPQQLTLTTPITPASRTTYSLERVTFDWVNELITVYLMGSDSVEISAYWSGPQAVTLMHQLNNANFSNNSLVSAIYNNLVSAGFVPAGIVTGVAS